MAANVYENAYDGRGFVVNEKYGDSVDCTRIWWVEAESIEGFLNEYRKSGDEKYLDAALSIWEYIKGNTSRSILLIEEAEANGSGQSERMISQFFHIL